MKETSRAYSKIAFLICAILLACSGSLFYPRWQNGGGEAQLSWDAGGYYWYLPSVFVYHDLKHQSFKDSVLDNYAPTPGDFQYAFKPKGSNDYVIRYTMGTAILESPAFFIAHIIAKRMGFPNDGFSKPYQLMIYLEGILFALLGLWYLRKLLLLYYSDKIVAWTLFLLVFGTNYLNYAGIDVGMTHTWLFTLYVFILLNTHYFYQTFKSKYVLRLGFLIGLIALIRPPEIMAVLIPLLWGLNRISIPIIKERFQLFAKHWKTLLAAAFITVVLLSFQFIYWKIASGHWFVYTYQNQGFSWRHPHFKIYALNYQCGWLWYTPMMFFSILGLIIYFIKGQNKVAIIALILLNYYVVASWNGWDYGGRAMVQSYPVLLFVLAAFVQFVFEANWKKWLFMPMMLLCVYFNLWWTYQAHKGSIIGSVPATGAYYWNTIFRYDVPLDYQKLRDNGDIYLKPVKNSVLIYNNSTDTGKASTFTISKDLKDTVDIPKPAQNYKYIRASANFNTPHKEWNVWFMTQFIVRIKKGNNVIRETNIRVQRLLNENEPQIITTDIKVKTEDYNSIEILFRNDNDGGSTCTVSDLKVFGFNN
jgi:hypothetical protein